jgi:hypothetical protein
MRNYYLKPKPFKMPSTKLNVPIAATSTEIPVQKQLDAYNARDIEAFMQCWADDCEYHEFPDRLLARGAAQIRERMVQNGLAADESGRRLANRCDCHIGHPHVTHRVKT